MNIAESSWINANVALQAISTRMADSKWNPSVVFEDCLVWKQSSTIIFPSHEFSSSINLRNVTIECSEFQNIGSLIEFIAYRKGTCSLFLKAGKTTMRLDTTNRMLATQHLAASFVYTVIESVENLKRIDIDLTDMIDCGNILKLMIRIHRYSLLELFLDCQEIPLHDLMTAFPNLTYLVSRSLFLENIPYLPNLKNLRHIYIWKKGRKEKDGDCLVINCFITANTAWTH